MPVPPSVSQLVQTSGNNFHAKVARWLQANGWHTQISPYYMDQTQDKARELDLVAEKVWPIRGSFNQYEGDLVVRLFVECKFVAAEAVFWFTPKDVAAVTQLVCRMGPFRENNTYTAKHHYLATSAKVAKLFASSNTRASENEPFFKALNQALNATVAMRDRKPTHPDLARRHPGKLVVLNYPVVVCSSFTQLYAVDFYGDGEPEAVRENFQLEVQYAFFDQSGSPRNELFLLDFVEFGKLGDFETAVAEGAAAGAYLASHG